jgi:hypothetical protein
MYSEYIRVSASLQESYARSCWLAMINARLNPNCTLTNQHRYGWKALPSKTVQRTWQGTLYDELNLPNDWHNISGVLVGIGVERLPGRNR